MHKMELTMYIPFPCTKCTVCSEKRHNLEMPPIVTGKPLDFTYYQVITYKCALLQQMQPILLLWTWTTCYNLKLNSTKLSRRHVILNSNGKWERSLYACSFPHMRDGTFFEGSNNDKVLCHRDNLYVCVLFLCCQSIEHSPLPRMKEGNY